MRRSIRNRDITFRHEDGCLVRTVTGTSGTDGTVRTYTHRCELAVFEKVAWAMEETPAEGEGTTMSAIVAAEGLPHTQVDVALAFLHERGIIDRRHRRNYPATSSVHLDAMVEWHALREEPTTACHHAPSAAEPAPATAGVVLAAASQVYFTNDRY